MSSSDIVTCELFSNGLVCELLAGHDQNVQKVMKLADDTVAMSNISLLSTLYGDLSWKTLWKMLVSRTKHQGNVVGFFCGIHI